MNRRRFLALAGGAALAPAAAPAGPRRLNLFNPHTGERFNGPYRDAKGPIPSAMQELSVFLRDFHCGAKIAYDVRVLDFLADILAAVGDDRAQILSAYRTPATNALLARTMFGVAEHSQHLYGRALDIAIGKLESAMMAARAMRRGGVGWYPASHFIHIDCGPVRNWNLDAGHLGRLLAGGPASRGSPRLMLVGSSGEAAPVRFPVAGHPLTVAERLALQKRLARAEFLARRR